MLLGGLGGLDDVGDPTTSPNPLLELAGFGGEGESLDRPGMSLAASLAAGRGPEPAVLGLGTLVLTGSLAAGLMGYRVTRSRRDTQARIHARLAAIAGPPPVDP